MMILARMVLVCLWTLLVVLTTKVYAEEQRCKDLGVNCVCSEPLNTSNLGRTGSYYYNPADSTTKECNAEAGAAIVRGPVYDLTAATSASDPAIFSALPAAHTNAYVTRGPYGHEGMFYFGQHVIAPAGSGKQRLAARWYIYLHPDTFSASDCGGSKLAEIWFANEETQHPSIYNLSGQVQLYNFTTWTPAQDCCFAIASPDGGTLNPAYWQGKWIRVEVVISRPNGQGATTPGTGPVEQIYVKDVTTPGQPELKVVDTSYPGTALNPGTQNRNPSAAITGLESNNHRQNPKVLGGPDIPCIGFKALSHYMAASWDTDAGQRIGSAYEIEGGGNVVAAPSGGGLPAAPSALTVGP